MFIFIVDRQNKTIERLNNSTFKHYLRCSKT